MRWLAALTALVAPTACTVRNATFLDAETTKDILTFRAQPNPDLDLLLVIDDSASMGDKQQALSDVFPNLVQELQSIAGGLPNLHVGVVSTDLGTSASNGGSAPAVGGCNSTGKAGVMQTNGVALSSGNFLIDQRDGVRNYTGDLAVTLAQMIRLGQNGCGFEQPLGAMRAALQNPANRDFLRPEANLAILVLSDEDDCSARDPAVFSTSLEFGAMQSFRCFQFGVLCDPDEPTKLGAKQGCRARPDAQYIEDVASFATFLRALKPDPHAVLFGAVVGDPEPVAVELRPPPGSGMEIPSVAHSCTFPIATGTAVADPALRIAQLAAQVNGHVESVCHADLSPALGAMGKRIRGLAGDRCLPGPPPEGDCVLVDTTPTGTATLPACDGSGADCWQIVTDAVACPEVPQLRVDVQRSAPVAPDTWSTLRCTLR